MDPLLDFDLAIGTKLSIEKEDSESAEVSFKFVDEKEAEGLLETLRQCNISYLVAIASVPKRCKVFKSSEISPSRMIIRYGDSMVVRRSSG